MDTTPANQVVPKSYLRNVIVKSSLIYLAGFSLTTILFYLALREPIGPSYGEGFMMLAKLQKDIIVMSIIIYTITVLMMVTGIILLTLIYSHRVAGPVYRLSTFLRSVRSGDLSRTVTLRKKDIIHPVAEDINTMINQYGKALSRVDREAKALEKCLRNTGAAHQTTVEQWEMTKKRAGNIKNYLAQYSV